MTRPDPPHPTTTHGCTKESCWIHGIEISRCDTLVIKMEILRPGATGQNPLTILPKIRPFLDNPEG